MVTKHKFKVLAAVFTIPRLLATRWLSRQLSIPCAIQPILGPCCVYVHDPAKSYRLYCTCAVVHIPKVSCHSTPSRITHVHASIAPTSRPGSLHDPSRGSARDSVLDREWRSGEAAAPNSLVVSDYQMEMTTFYVHPQSCSPGLLSPPH